MGLLLRVQEEEKKLKKKRASDRILSPAVHLMEEEEETTIQWQHWKMMMRRSDEIAAFEIAIQKSLTGLREVESGLVGRRAVPKISSALYCPGEVWMSNTDSDCASR